MITKNVSAVILAAGRGTRMKSKLPKVLHIINGKPMVKYAVEACRGVGIDRPLLIIGDGREQVREAMGDSVDYAEQLVQSGTGHAVQMALPSLPESGSLLVLCGDTPLLRAATLEALLQRHIDEGASCTLLSAVVDNPAGYGRICRDAGRNIVRIAEQKDATAEERAIKEINTGVYCFDISFLRRGIGKLKNNNAQGEYYLTDVPSLIRAEGGKIASLMLADGISEVMGVNDREQLAVAASFLRARKLRQLMLQGVTIVNPNSVYIEDGVTVGADTVIEPNTILRGSTVVGEDCLIGPSSDISDSVIGDGSTVAYSVLVGVTAAAKAIIGPFSYMRPGTELAENVKVGGFVETKKAIVGKGSKIPHLSYVGDTEIGENVNVGCGTITCNYDGYDKYKTIIGDEVFIGSNVNLIAPIVIGNRSFVAAGSTVSEDVPEGALGVGRGKQRNIEGWADKYHKDKSAAKNKD